MTHLIGAEGDGMRPKKEKKKKKIHTYKLYIYVYQCFLCFHTQTHTHIYFTFTFMHLADAFIQSDLQLHSGYTFSLVCVIPGNRTHNLLRC